VTDKAKPPGVSIGQVFLERADFSHRDDFLALPPNKSVGKPSLLLGFQGGTSPDGRAGFVRATAQTDPTERPLYNLTVTMIALVEVEKGHENMPLGEYLRTAGLAMLFPFLREAVANLTIRGRFGPLWLAPTNIAAAAAAEQLPKIQQPSREKKAKNRAKARS